MTNLEVNTAQRKKFQQERAKNENEKEQAGAEQCQAQEKFC